MSVGEKPVMNVDDLYVVLHHHWTKDATPYPDGRQIIQLAFLLLVSAYTASRPGALVYVEKNERTNVQHFFSNSSDGEGMHDTENWDLRSEDLKTLCYGQISLILLPNPGGARDHLVMEVDLKHTKGHHSNPKRKIFLMSEVKQPIFDVIILVLAMAILDDAFESNINSVEDVFKTRVLSPRRSLKVKFKPEKLNVPICRQPVSTISGMKTHSIKPLKYHTYLYYLQRLSLAVGMVRAMRPYDLRRGTGEAVDKTASLPLLQQVMGHAYASTFQKYMNQRVQTHVQAAFLGVPSQDALMNIVSHQSRYIDPRAPSHYEDLSTTAKQTWRDHPEIVQLKQMRDALATEAKELYGSLSKAAGTKLGELKDKTDALLRTKKAKLKNGTFIAAREVYFATIDTLEINKQLDPSPLDLDQGTYEPKAIVHRLKERRQVAELIHLSFQDAAENETEPKDLDESQSLTERQLAFLRLSKKDDMGQRIVLINALIDLGRVEKVPSERTISETESQCTANDNQTSSCEVTSCSKQDQSSSPEPRDGPICLTNRHCLFCVFEPNFQCYFATPRKAREHFEKHLRALERNGRIPCPDRFCNLVLHGHQALKNHAKRVHSVTYFTEAQRIHAGF
ncbi:hypothetical protein N7451_008786 [Penicillium sp. IBT 35674x]|nr:hypothetical protein N7451_008786 [Penicillium sp. IBT 35674x]